MEISNHQPLEYSPAKKVGQRSTATGQRPDQRQRAGPGGFSLDGKKETVDILRRN